MTNELPVADDVANLLAQTSAIREIATELAATSSNVVTDYIGLVQRTCADKSKAIEKTNTIIAGLAPLAAIVNTAVDLASSLAPLCDAADAVCHESTRVSHALGEVNTNAARNVIRVPRPSCALLRTEVPAALRNKPAPTYDEFMALNSESSVLSRLRFQLDENQEAVGVVVLIIDGNGIQVLNNFEFQSFIPVAETTLGRTLDIDNTSDGYFLYKLVLWHAVQVADITVSGFGPLTPALAVTSMDRQDTFSVETDTVGPELMFSSDPDAGDGKLSSDVEAILDQVLAADPEPAPAPVRGLRPELSGDSIEAYRRPIADAEPAEEVLDTTMDTDLASQLEEEGMPAEQSAGGYDQLVAPGDPLDDLDGAGHAESADPDELGTFLGSDDDDGEVVLLTDTNEPVEYQRAPAQAGFTVDPSLSMDDGEGVVQLATEDDLPVDVTGGDADVRLGGGSPLSRFAD